MGTAVMTRAVLPGNRERSFRHLRKDPLDHWCLVLCDPSPAQGAPSGDQTRLTSRELGIRSLGRSFDAVVSDTTVLSLYIPRDLFASSAGVLDAAEGNLMTTGLTALLADYLTALERRLPQIGIDAMERVAEMTGNIIAACLAPTADRMDAARPAANWTLVERARRAIHQNLANQNLTPDDLCRLIGTSRSKLYRLFEPFGGVAHYIQRQRLREGRALLGRSGDALSVGRIGEQVGFSDLSSFSRAFRREFGMSPSDVRGAVLPKAVSAVGMPMPATADASVLATALRSLRG